MTRRITGSRPDVGDDDIEGGSEREEVRRAPAGPNLLATAGRRKVAVASTPTSADKIQARAMLERAKRAATNRFAQSDGENLLPVPPDDETYHYGYVRHSIGGRTDVGNLQTRLHGRLPWETVPIAELTPEWQVKLGFLKAKDGDFAGSVAIEDLVLMRCDRQAYEEYREWEQFEADKLVLDTKSKWVELLDQQGLRPKDPFEVDELVREERF